jgi:hypothetical protein
MSGKQPKPGRGRSSWADYADMLALLSHQPMKVAQLACASGITAKAASRVLRTMHFMDILAAVGQGSSVVFCAQAGGGGDATLTRPRPMSDLITFCCIVRFVQQFRGTADEYSDLSGASPGRVRALLKHLAHVAKLAHVESWVTQTKPGGGGPPIPVYAWGAKENCHRPTPMSRRRKEQRRRVVESERSRFADLVFLTAGRRRRRLVNEAKGKI